MFPSVCVCLRLSVCVCELFNGCIYQRMLVYKVDTFLKRIKMAVLFLIFLDQICPKWIKLDQIGFSRQPKNVTMKSCHIFRKDKNGCLVFDFLDQICPKWIKLHQTRSKWISHKSKSVSIKSFHIYKKDKNGCSVFDFFGSDLSKMDQTWSNWISSPI
mgnify:CR=1 FL=1